MLLKCVQPVFTENDEAKQSGTKSWARLCQRLKKKVQCYNKKSDGKNLSIKSVKRIKWLCHAKGKAKIFFL